MKLQTADEEKDYYLACTIHGHMNAITMAVSTAHNDCQNSAETHNKRRTDEDWHWPGHTHGSQAVLATLLNSNVCPATEQHSQEAVPMVVGRRHGRHNGRQPIHVDG